MSIDGGESRGLDGDGNSGGERREGDDDGSSHEALRPQLHKWRKRQRRRTNGMEFEL